jgi:hypothetical protein
MAISVLHSSTTVTVANVDHLTLTITSTTAGSVVAVGGLINTAAVSITGVTDSASHTYTLATNSTATRGAGSRTAVWYYYLTPGAGVTSVTLNLSGLTGGGPDVSIFAVEVAGFTTPAFDQGDHLSNGTESGTDAAGPTDTSLSVPEIFLALCFPGGDLLTAATKTGNAFTGLDYDPGSGSADAYLVTSGAGNVQCIWTDSSSGNAYCVSVMAIREAGGGGGSSTIAIDASADGGRATATSQTWTHTCTGSNLILFVGVLNGAVETISTVTYNGVGLTKLGIDLISHLGSFRLTLWYLLGPATGAHSVVVTPSASSDTMGTSVSYTGVTQGSFPDASDHRQPIQTASITETLTTVADNTWMVWFGLDEFGTSETAGAGTFLRKVSSGYGGLFFADSNAALTPAGSHSLVMNPSTSTDWMHDIFLSIAPAPAAGSPPIPHQTYMVHILTQ